MDPAFAGQRQGTSGELVVMLPAARWRDLQPLEREARGGQTLPSSSGEGAGELAKLAEFAPGSGVRTNYNFFPEFALFSGKLFFSTTEKNDRMCLLCLKIWVFSLVSPFPLPKLNLCSYSCLFGAEKETRWSF